MYGSDLWEKIKQFDFSVLFIITTISSIGLLMLYSAAGGHWHPWAIKQLMRFGMGVIVLITVAMIDIRFWRNIAAYFYGLSLLLLIFVEFKGHIGMGAQRWIDLGIFQLQPSELMKISLILMLAEYFHTRTAYDISKLRTYILPLILIGIPSALVLKQPDLGTMIILAASGAVIIFISGLGYWKIMTAAGLILGSLPLLWSQMHTYQKNRVLTFLNPESDPLGTGYHIMQSKIAIGSGGFFGKGLMQGSQSQLNFLPEKQTDFIFAMFCEEFGVFGALLLLGLYVCLIVHGLRIGLESKNLFGRLLGVGFTCLFFFYVFVNTAMVMGLLPVVGVPLPFMSYGGTSMLSLMLGFGLLISVSIHRQSRFGRSY
jgi:rod shape determining protein RodA